MTFTTKLDGRCKSMRYQMLIFCILPFFSEGVWMCVCLCVAPKLYEKSEFANATDTNMTFTTKLVGRCKAMQDPLTISDFLYTSMF